MLSIFILSIATGPSSVTAEASNSQTIQVTVLHPDGTPASGALVDLLLHDPGQVIAVAKTDLNGRVDFSVDLSRLTVRSLNKMIADIHFAIRSCGYPDEFAIRHFTKTIVLDRLRFNSAEANEMEGGSEFHLQLRLDKVKPFSS
ncbi:hypothetical protein [Thermaerobacter marianensis]|uniref:hypothetical protein n=1 Tax=Thermaerobacter marianensis TaxID=73919 RepID=UPI0011D19E00|nr:hypothetical protein [Thermaerobacter marianensis]